MGLNDSDLILIASRPGMGKTSIALNIALNVAKKSGKTVAVFSLEMSR
jgi:replicative DNA helicase